MPHVVFDKKINLQSIQSCFRNILVKEANFIRIKDAFLNNQQNQLLIDTVVIESSSQIFFIEISSSDHKTTVRLHPSTDPQKTDGVKKSLALVAKQILCSNPGISVTKTNISEYLVLDLQKIMI